MLALRVICQSESRNYIIVSLILIALCGCVCGLPFQRASNLQAKPVRSAFVPVQPLKCQGTSLSSSTVYPTIDTDELAKVFSRISDKTILLDIPEAGHPGLVNCCHSGCDNCEFARIFDQLSSARCKWVACYTYREFVDGRSHVPTWAAIFKDSSPQQLTQASSIDRSQFIERVRALPSQATLGPPSTSPDPPHPQTLVLLWEKLLRLLREDGAADVDMDDTLTAEKFASAMRLLTTESHGTMWQAFCKALG